MSKKYIVLSPLCSKDGTKHWYVDQEIEIDDPDVARKLLEIKVIRKLHPGEQNHKSVGVSIYDFSKEYEGEELESAPVEKQEGENGTTDDSETGYQ